jgi:hypothetical protein
MSCRIPHPFGVERAPIEERAHLGFLAPMREHVELLLRAVVLAGEAQQLEKERAPLGICRIIAQLRPESLDGLVQLSRLQESSGGHGGAGEGENAGAWDAEGRRARETTRARRPA